MLSIIIRNNDYPQSYHQKNFLRRGCGGVDIISYLCQRFLLNDTEKMTELQEKMAVKALDYIAEHDGVCTKNDLLKDMRLKGDGSNLAKANRDIVLDKLTKEIQLIRVTGENLVSLTENGELAQKMGFEKYMKKLHGNERLDIKLKRMDFWLKLMDLIGKSKPVIFIAAVVLCLIWGLLMWTFSLFSPTLTQATLFLSGMALGAFLIYILSVRQAKRHKQE